MYHKPVLLNESVSALVQNPKGTYIDATFGGGGHTAAILSRLHQSGRLIAFDRDIDALANVPEDRRFRFVRNNFRFVQNFSLLLAGGQVDGILADLGVSWHQFDSAERGFSFRYDAPLDMRMNQNSEKTAADLVNCCEQDRLEEIFRVYGEVENAKKLAWLIVDARRKKPIRTTSELNEAISSVTPQFMAHKYLAKVYQALRIELNDELRSLRKFLHGAVASLKPGGRLAVITYHSLEDRMVKNFIRYGNTEGRQEKDLYGNLNAPLKAVERKPIVPSEYEIAQNPRARSAKLRVAEKREGLS